MTGDRFASMRAAAARREHGTRARYVGGCRCLLCRAANSRYETERAAARGHGDRRHLVPATETRLYLEHLSTIGVGYKSVAATVGCSHTTLAKIINGTRHRVRAHLAARVLEVDRSAVADHALVPAGPTWKLLDELIAAGYTKRWLAEQLGYKAKLKRDWVWAINASRVERLYRRLQDGRISR